ncbi:MAG: hypothetical protein WDN75_01750 [Bacteroidota bacterium]
MPNTWGTRSLTASPDFRLNFDIARAMKNGGHKFDNITSISYAQTNQLLELEQNYYDAYFCDESKEYRPVSF